MLRAAPMAGAPGGRPPPGPAVAEVLSIAAAAERSAGRSTGWSDEDLLLASCCEAAEAAESDDAAALQRRRLSPPPDAVVDAAWSRADDGSSAGENGSNSGGCLAGLLPQEGFGGSGGSDGPAHDDIVFGELEVEEAFEWDSDDDRGTEDGDGDDGLEEVRRTCDQAAELAATAAEEELWPAADEKQLLAEAASKAPRPAVLCDQGWERLTGTGSATGAAAAKLVQGMLTSFFAPKRSAGGLLTTAANAGPKRQRSIGSYFGLARTSPHSLPSEPLLALEAGSTKAAWLLAPAAPKLQNVASKPAVASEPAAAAVRPCPFYKKMPGTSFTVDAFRFGRIPGCSAYFLTHFHSDHYGGLSRAWRHGPIYCTPPTGRLVVMCLGVDPKWIVGLEENQTAVVQGVEVTMLPANHCPGAAIILFRLPWGDHILHTGDFRACTAMRAYPHLQGVHIKLLYLDTTYCNTRYKFPPQEDVIQFAVQCTRRMLQRSKRLLITVGAYSIGKERVYLALAQALGVKIYVDKRRERVLGALDWPELQAYLTSDASTTPLHVVPIGYLRPPRLKSYLQNYHSFMAILGFRPTGWTYSEKIGARLELIQPQRWGPVTVYGIPYSEHSSCTELKEFVQHFKPEKIIPTVNVSSPASRERMNGLFRQWQNKGLQD
eukprot:SM000010S04335  [mRNA]  locus=s10:1039380:1043186:+ [translate_table: standard]